MLRLATLLCLAAGTALAVAESAEVTGTVVHFPESVLAVTLDGGAQRTTPTGAGMFTFHDVAPGTHRIDVDSHKVAYASYTVTVSPTGNVKVQEFQYPGAPAIPISSLPIPIKAVAGVQYFPPPPSFSLLGLLMNPTVLIMGVMVAAMVFLPSMMEGMDPAQKEEMRKQQETMGNPAAMLTGGGGGDMGSIMSSLMGQEPPQGAAPADSAPIADPYAFAAQALAGGGARSSRKAPALGGGRGKKKLGKRR